jgi:NADH:ubiquinone oxidoreductase subunit 6 (subunit J)
LMLNNEYNSDKIITKYSFENILLFIIFFKTFYLISCLNLKISLFKTLSLVQYLPTYIENNYFLKNFTENHSDVVNFISLYTEKSLLLIILGLILLFTMLGVIVITKKKYV